MGTLSVVPTTQSCVSTSELGTRLHTGQSAGFQLCSLQRGSTVYRTPSWVPMVFSIERFHCIQDSQLVSNGVIYKEVPLYTGQPAGFQWCLYREVPLYTGQPAGFQWCPLQRGSTVYRTPNWVPAVSSIERFHCIQDSQLGPSGVLYREVPLYTGQPAGSQRCPYREVPL